MSDLQNNLSYESNSQVDEGTRAEGVKTSQINFQSKNIKQNQRVNSNGI